MAGILELLPWLEARNPMRITKTRKSENTKKRSKVRDSRLAKDSIFLFALSCFRVFVIQIAFAFAPFASRFPFETWVLPKNHTSHFENIQISIFRTRGASCQAPLWRLLACLETTWRTYYLTWRTYCKLIGFR